MSSINPKKKTNPPKGKICPKQRPSSDPKKQKPLNPSSAPSQVKSQSESKTHDEQPEVSTPRRRVPLHTDQLYVPSTRQAAFEDSPIPSTSYPVYSPTLRPPSNYPDVSVDSDRLYQEIYGGLYDSDIQSSLLTNEDFPDLEIDSPDILKDFYDISDPLTGINYEQISVPSVSPTMGASPSRIRTPPGFIPYTYVPFEYRSSALSTPLSQVTEPEFLSPTSIADSPTETPYQRIIIPYIIPAPSRYFAVSRHAVPADHIRGTPRRKVSVPPRRIRLITPDRPISTIPEGKTRSGIPLMRRAIPRVATSHPSRIGIPTTSRVPIPSGKPILIPQRTAIPVPSRRTIPVFSKRETFVSSKSTTTPSKSEMPMTAERIMTESRISVKSTTPISEDIISQSLDRREKTSPETQTTCESPQQESVSPDAKKLESDEKEISATCPIATDYSTFSPEIESLMQSIKDSSIDYEDISSDFDLEKLVKDIYGDLYKSYKSETLSPSAKDDDKSDSLLESEIFSPTFYDIDDTLPSGISGVSPYLDDQDVIASSPDIKTPTITETPRGIYHRRRQKILEFSPESTIGDISDTETEGDTDFEFITRAKPKYRGGPEYGFPEAEVAEDEWTDTPFPGFGDTPMHQYFLPAIPRQYRRRSDVPPTPPPFSRDPYIRQRYKPLEVEDDSLRGTEWLSGEIYFQDMKEQPIYVDSREERRQLDPSYQFSMATPTQIETISSLISPNLEPFDPFSEDYGDELLSLDQDIIPTNIITRPVSPVLPSRYRRIQKGRYRTPLETIRERVSPIIPVPVSPLTPEPIRTPPRRWIDPNIRTPPAFIPFKYESPGLLEETPPLQMSFADYAENIPDIVRRRERPLSPRKPAFVGPLNRILKATTLSPVIDYVRTPPRLQPERYLLPNLPPSAQYIPPSLVPAQRMRLEWSPRRKRPPLSPEVTPGVRRKPRIGGMRHSRAIRRIDFDFPDEMAASRTPPAVSEVIQEPLAKTTVSTIPEESPLIQFDISPTIATRTVAPSPKILTTMPSIYSPPGLIHYTPMENLNVEEELSKIQKMLESAHYPSVQPTTVLVPTPPQYVPIDYDSINVYETRESLAQPGVVSPTHIDLIPLDPFTEEYSDDLLYLDQDILPSNIITRPVSPVLPSQYRRIQKGRYRIPLETIRERVSPIIPVPVSPLTPEPIRTPPRRWIDPNIRTPPAFIPFEYESPGLLEETPPLQMSFADYAENIPDIVRRRERPLSPRKPAFIGPLNRILKATTLSPVIDYVRTPPILQPERYLLPNLPPSAQYIPPSLVPAQRMRLEWSPRRKRPPLSPEATPGVRRKPRIGGMRHSRAIRRIDFDLPDEMAASRTPPAVSEVIQEPLAKTTVSTIPEESPLIQFDVSPTKTTRTVAPSPKILRRKPSVFSPPGLDYDEEKDLSRIRRVMETLESPLPATPPQYIPVDYESITPQGIEEISPVHLETTSPDRSMLVEMIDPFEQGLDDELFFDEVIVPSSMRPVSPILPSIYSRIKKDRHRFRLPTVEERISPVIPIANISPFTPVPSPTPRRRWVDPNIRTPPSFVPFKYESPIIAEETPPFHMSFADYLENIPDIAERRERPLSPRKPAFIGPIDRLVRRPALSPIPDYVRTPQRLHPEEYLFANIPSSGIQIPPTSIPGERMRYEWSPRRRRPPRSPESTPGVRKRPRIGGMVHSRAIRRIDFDQPPATSPDLVTSSFEAPTVEPKTPTFYPMGMADSPTRSLARESPVSLPYSPSSSPLSDMPFDIDVSREVIPSQSLIYETSSPTPVFKTPPAHFIPYSYSPPEYKTPDPFSESYPYLSPRTPLSGVDISLISTTPPTPPKFEPFHYRTPDPFEDSYLLTDTPLSGLNISLVDTPSVSTDTFKDISFGTPISAIDLSLVDSIQSTPILSRSPEEIIVPTQQATATMGYSPVVESSQLYTPILISESPRTVPTISPDREYRIRKKRKIRHRDSSPISPMNIETVLVTPSQLLIHPIPPEIARQQDIHLTPLSTRSVRRRGTPYLLPPRRLYHPTLKDVYGIDRSGIRTPLRQRFLTSPTRHMYTPFRGYEEEILDTSPMQTELLDEELGFKWLNR